jgi:hypothetical protein
MQLLKHRSVAYYISFVLLLMISIATSTIPAFADSGPVRATLNSGYLTESRATNQVMLNVDRKIEAVTYSLPITVTDARGSGSGWNLMITSTRFKTQDGDRDEDQLPASASRVSTVSVSCGTSSTCTKPIDSVSYPVGVPAGYPLPASVKFFNAAISSGLGKFQLTMMVNVSIPAHTEPGIYSSTIILTIANGP